MQAIARADELHALTSVIAAGRVRPYMVGRMAKSLRMIDEMPEPAVRPRLALAAKGFRPFFLLAAGFAAAIVPIWVLVFLGVLPPSVYLDPTTWHAHEMVFGFAGAVIAGFLLTAAANWTKRETATGAPLLGLATLWVLGRIAILAAAALPRGVPAAIDLAFWVGLFVALARPIVAAKNRRNFVMLGLVAALFAANLVVHLDALGVTPMGSGRRACWVAIDLVVVMMLVMAGRVFPMFTRNATGVQSIRSVPALDVATGLAAAALALVDALAWQSIASALVAGIVAVVAAARATHWGALRTAKNPLLWILHAGYAWIVVGLSLRALSPLWPADSGSLALHALTVGAIGSLTIGMMARVALGHTGRALAAPKAMTLAFVAIQIAAFARAFLPIFAHTQYLGALDAAASLWSVAFLVFLVVYTPMLLSPRVDGKAG